MDQPQTRIEDQWRPEVIRVFVSAELRDVQAEREYLDMFVFPRLRELCASRGVILNVIEVRERIDRGYTAPADVLQLTLEELQRSRPYYIGLIGGDYGRGVEQLPDEFLGHWPALAQYHGRSISELEIVYGVLSDEAMRGRGFFYFRDPKFTDTFTDIKAHEIGNESGQESYGARNLEKLKQSIRDFSQQGICRLRENYRDFAELGEWILDDFQRLIDELSPVPEKQTEIKPYDDDVMFTVYRPETVIPQKWYSLLAFAHLSKRRPGAAADEPDPVAEVGRVAERMLGEKLAEYRTSSQDSSSSVPLAGEITFQPFLKGFEFNPTSRSFRWEESVHYEEFRMRAITAPDNEVAKGWLRVYLGPLILAQVNLSIKVDSKFVSQQEKQPQRTVSAAPLRKVFASYSHKDREIVERIEECLSRSYLGIEYMRDVKKLRAGEKWSQRLMEMIDEAQAFQLFWSTNSMHSKFVRQEYEYALALRREDFVRPVFWETPFPEKPEAGLPPDELRSLHFAQMENSSEGLDSLPKRRTVKRRTVQTTSYAGAPSMAIRAAGERADTPAGGFGAPQIAARAPARQRAQRSRPSPDTKIKKSHTGPALAGIVAIAILAVGLTSVMWFAFRLRNNSGLATYGNANSNSRYGTGEIEGSVTDLAGRPLANITVRIQNGPETRTDENGLFVLSGVPPGIQLIETESSSNQIGTQTLSIPSTRKASVSLIYDAKTSRLGLVSITDPADGTMLKAARVGDEFRYVISGRCDGLKEMLGKFDVWVLIRQGDDSRLLLQRPAAITNPDSNAWQATVVFGKIAKSSPSGRRFEIFAIAVRSDSDLQHLLARPDSNVLRATAKSTIELF